MNNLKKIVSLILILSFVLAVTACSNNTDDNTNTEDGIIATVNGKTLTQEEYDETLSYFKNIIESQYGENAWETQEVEEGVTYKDFYEGDYLKENLILTIILVDAAEKQGITINDEQLQQELENYKAYYSSDKEYQDDLEKNGMTEEFLLTQLKNDFLIRNYLDLEASKLNPSDSELEQIFNDLKMGELVRASHILVSTEEEADKVIERLNSGEVFEDIAKEVSLDPVSGANGGDLDYFSFTDMVQPFSEAAFAMEVGGISDPVKSDYGYHIIKVVDKKVDETITLESQKELLKSYYSYFKEQELVARLRNEADVSIK